MQKIKDKDIDNFIIENNLSILKNNNFPIFNKLINYSKNDNLYEKIEGASIIFLVDNNRSFYVNGFFKQDSLGISKKILNFDNKMH